MKLLDIVVGEEESQSEVRETIMDILAGKIPEGCRIDVSKPNRRCHAAVIVYDNRYSSVVANALYT